MAVVITRKKVQKKCVIKLKRKFEDYKNCPTNNVKILKAHQRFRSEAHNAFTEKVNKIPLSSNDAKRSQTFDGIASYPYDTSAGKRYLPNIDKICLYAKDPYDAKHQLLIDKQ